MPENNPVGGFFFGLKIFTPAGNVADYEEGSAIFRSVSGLSNETEMQEVTQGGNTAHTHKIPGVRKWKNIILKTGITGDLALFKWKFAPKRASGAIIMFTHERKEICRWEFTDGYPVKWESSDLDSGKNEIAIETLEIAHHGLVFTTKKSAPAPAPPPPAPPPPPPEPVNAEVRFPVNSSTVPKPSPQLDKAADDLKKNPERKVKIEADTDSTGSAATNKTLSQNRANSVKDQLISSGVKPEQVVSAIGYGKDRCVAAIGDNKNDPSWRRTKVTDA